MCFCYLNDLGIVIIVLEAFFSLYFSFFLTKEIF